MPNKELTPEEQQKRLEQRRAAGAKGGRAKVPKGFAIMKQENPERFIEVSKMHVRKKKDVKE